MGTESAAERLEAEITHSRLTSLERKQRDMADELMELKASMDSNTSALNDFIELGKNLKFGLKLLNAVESAAVWITKVSAALLTVWAIWKYGVLEALRHARS